MEIPLLKDIVIILLLAMGVVYLSQRIRIPVIVGLLVTGVLAGPHALGLVSAISEVEQLAKVGIILLLFTIGIEFSLRKLLKIKLLVLVGGSIQVTATVLAVFAVTYYAMEWSFGSSLFMGFLMSLSSTAIVLKILQDRAQIESPPGRIALGILIFQDVIVVLFIIVTPLLAVQADSGSTPSLLRLALTGVVLVLFVLLGSRYVVPTLLYQAVRTRSRELFLLTVVGICFAVALMAAELSLALGAFLAGLAISESEHSHDAFELVRPFRDLFTSFFFVSIGMLLDLSYLLAEPLLILLVTLAVLVGKSLIVILTVILLGYPLRAALISGLTLNQVGEFAFILATVGAVYALLPPDAAQLFLAVSVLTMAATSFLMAGAPRFADLILRVPLPDRLVSGLYPVRNLDQPDSCDLQDHLVIIGFGINGRNVARAAGHAGIPYAVIEMNIDTVREERKGGEPIFYGDATFRAVLEMVSLPEARTVVLTLADAATTRRVAALVRELNPGGHLIARTRYVSEMEALYRLGVNEVIPEEFETSVEIFTRVLTRYLTPKDEIIRLATEIRGDSYSMFRSHSRAADLSMSDLHLHLKDIDVTSLFVSVQSPLNGMTLAELDLRRRTGVTLLAIRRGGELLTNPAADVVFVENDELFLIGTPEQISGLLKIWHD